MSLCHSEILNINSEILEMDFGSIQRSIRFGFRFGVWLVSEYDLMFSFGGDLVQFRIRFVLEFGSL